jgi:hypothetical protein
MTYLVANDIGDGNYEDILNEMSKGATIRVAKDAERELAIRDTWYLGYHVLGYDWLDSEFHPALARYLDQHWDQCQLHLHPRGHLKTTLLTITATTRRILLDPNHTEGIMANTDDNASKMLGGIKSHFIENNKFRDLFPEHAVRKKFDEGTTEKFSTPARTKKWITESTVETFSVKKAAVSRHYSHVTFEDIQDDKNAKTKSLRDDVDRRFGETLSLLNPDPKTGLILWTMVGTRWHHDDVYGRLLKSIKHTHNKSNIAVLITEFENNGELLFPERRTWDYFDDMLDRQKEYVFNCQYRNTPIRDDQKDFFTEDLEYYDYVPNKQPFKDRFNRYLLVDPGGWDEKGGVIHRDACVIAVYDVNTDGHIWLRKVYRGVWNPDEQQNKFFEAYRAWTPIRDIGIESVAWQKALSFYIRRRAERESLHFEVTDIKRGIKSKHERHKSFGGYLANGEIHIPKYPDDPKYDEDRRNVRILIRELDESPAGETDDILDTLADCVEIMNVPRKRKKKRDAYRKPSRTWAGNRNIQTGYSYCGAHG